MSSKLLSVENLEVQFDTRYGLVRAVSDISFELEKGKVLGIVGESGSGKSVACLAMMGLIPCPPGKIAGGRALLDGEDLLTMSEKELQKIRGKRVSMIFQEPMTSLNPYLKISAQLLESLSIHENVNEQEGKRRVIDMLERVGIPEPELRYNQYPHEFSGGMRQRVMIAMALLTRPEILIADEPTTALDVTVQAQILDLIRDIQEEFGMSVILISHDLGIVSQMSQEVIVMYAGKVAERGTPKELFHNSAHPYTRGLINSIPQLKSDVKILIPIKGNPPEPGKMPTGCPFHPRCSYLIDTCIDNFPDRKRRSDTQSYSCHVDIEVDQNA